MVQNTPYILIQPSIAKQNISRLALRLQKQGIKFRPHTKTHQSAAVAEWFKPYTSTITVSSWEMAVYFAENGWLDLLVAYPFHIPPNFILRKLKMQHAKISVLVDHPEQIRMLKCLGLSLQSVYIEIDCGYSRSGVAWEDQQRVRDIIDALTINDLEAFGLYSHFGTQYHVADDIQRKYSLSDGLEKLRTIKNRFGLMDLKLAIGDTPSSSLSVLPKSINSFHAGNFIFFDMQQLSMGVCRSNDIGLALVTEVVSSYPQRGEFLIKAGSVHLSKDYYLDSKGRQSFGLVIRMLGKTWNMAQPIGWIRLLSQEHAIVSEMKTMPKIGEKVAVIPAHSCLAASNFNEYLTPDGEVISKLRAF